MQTVSTKVKTHDDINHKSLKNGPMASNSLVKNIHEYPQQLKLPHLHIISRNKGIGENAYIIEDFHISHSHTTLVPHSLTTKTKEFNFEFAF